METQSMCEKILTTLENIINSDPEIEDLTILTSADNLTNTCPVYFQEHHLGLESWCLKILYQYVCSEIFEYRKRKSMKKLREGKKNYNLKGLLMVGLFVNPDVTTFWNMRRELVEEGVTTYKEELFFSKLVLSRKCKSNDAFAYRRWLFETMKKRSEGATERAQLFRNEFDICTAAANQSSNNYHAWTHRIWCFQRFVLFFPELLERELYFSESWIANHVSENSGYHYRRLVVNFYRKSTCRSKMCYAIVSTQKVEFVLSCVLSREEFLPLWLLLEPFKNADEIQPNRGLILLLYELLIVIDNVCGLRGELFGNYECIWFYRRFILNEIFLNPIKPRYGFSLRNTPKIDLVDTRVNGNERLVNNFVNLLINNDEQQSKRFTSQPNLFETLPLYKFIRNYEKKLIKKYSNSVNQIPRILARKHEKWIKYFLGIDLSE